MDLAAFARTAWEDLLLFLVGSLGAPEAMNSSTCGAIAVCMHAPSSRNSLRLHDRTAVSRLVASVSEAGLPCACALSGPGCCMRCRMHVDLSLALGCAYAAGWTSQRSCSPQGSSTAQTVRHAPCGPPLTPQPSCSHKSSLLIRPGGFVSPSPPDRPSPDFAGRLTVQPSPDASPLLCR